MIAYAELTGCLTSVVSLLDDNNEPSRTQCQTFLSHLHPHPAPLVLSDMPDKDTGISSYQVQSVRVSIKVSNCRQSEFFHSQTKTPN